MEPLLYCAIVATCLAASAFFSGGETALLRIRETELEEDIQQARGPAALAARDLLRSTPQLLVTILLGNNVANILGASVASALAVRYLGEQAGIVVATVTMTLFVFLFCEVLPKAFAARYPRRIGYAVALPLYLFHQALRPLHLLYDRFVDPIVKSLGGGDTAAISTTEEIMRLARGVAPGYPSGTPLAIIAAAVQAAERTAAEIMVPRTEILAFPVETPPAELLDRMLAERYTRVPIYEETIDQIVGVVHFKDLVELVRHGGTDLRTIVKPVLHVPERKPILRLLADMQRAFVHMAIVKDEFGVTLGLVTQEDILEELVGEIRDEFDREELLTIRKVGPNRYQAAGRVKVLDFNRETGWNVEAERGDTLAGLVFNQLGQAPRRGASVFVNGYEIVVLDTSGTRITQVEVIDRRAESEEKERAAEAE
ncbi:MAG: membrane protein [Candidatus Binatia bacterium]|nr:MAG: membrane protein [Candidatus Binatia bacterium]